MTRRCIIEGCVSRSGIVQHRGVTFHSFPFDSKTRDIWLVNCRIEPDKNITKSVLVCSRHFRKTDFQPLKANKYLLKSGAVPTIFPWGELPYVESKHTVQSDGPQLEQDSEKSSAGDISPNNETPVDSPIPNQSYNIVSKRPSVGLLQSDRQPNQSELAQISRKSSSQDENSLVTGETICESIKMEVDATAINEGSTTTGNNKVNNFNVGEMIEALDFDGLWHSARVVEVDNDEKEVLIRFEKSGKSKASTGIEEWIPMNSSRLRERRIQQVVKPVINYQAGEKCLARWTGNRRFPAIINKVLGNDSYEVLFDDGFVKTVKGLYITKIKAPAEKATVEKKHTTLTKASSKQTMKKDWPLISMSSLNLEELNLPTIPTDGEWCCHWVNDQPIGKEGFLTVGDHRKPTVIVEDWRLPPNWTKHMYQRSNILGKWDVILVNPAGKRFRSKADLKLYIEEMGQTYNPDVYDFSIHRRRAKDIGAYVYTKEYKAAQTAAAAAAEKQANVIAVPTVETSVPQQLQQIAQQLSIPSPTMLKEDDSPLEDGYVYVGSLKVQIVENLFRCPQEGCNKNFRKENHLQIHIKHYHEEIAKLLGVFPNMQELAYKRTIGQPTEDPLPKNHLSNAQFFAKLHQQDLQTKHHRKTNSTPSTPRVATPPITSPSVSSVDIHQKPLEDESSKVSDVEARTALTIATSEQPNSEMLNSFKDVPHATGDLSDKEDIKPIIKTKKHETNNRKSSRQRLTKKYLESNSAGTFDGNFGINDFEETRHSFNGTPEARSAKKPKLMHTSFVGEGILDANSHTTGSFPEHSQSPQYINENGEIIKIVRMRQEEIINCLCSYGEEDGLMIQCELCLCWQHGICNGFEKQSQVPEKYICYICRNPQRGRTSLKYIHDQDWLYEGKLPIANYHAQNPATEDRFNILRKTHTLTGNLLELKRFLHSLKVKINIAENKDHPKMYLWAKKWETSPVKELKANEKMITDSASNTKEQLEGKPIQNSDAKDNNIKVKEESVEDNSDNTATTAAIPENVDINFNPPTIPQPEAAIDPIECQLRLLEHIQKQQSSVMDRLQTIESQIMEIESLDNSAGMESDDSTKAEKTVSMLIKDLEIMRNIAKINTVQSNNYVNY